MIKFNDVAAQWDVIKEEALPKIERFLASGNYIASEEEQEFDDNFANYTGSIYSKVVSNGTDALNLAITALGPHNNTVIIMQSNTFIAGAFAASHNNCKILFVDCNPYFQINTNQIEHWLNINHKWYDKVIILATHLYGHPADMDAIMEVAKRYNCFIIEDCAQAHGAVYKDIQVGRFGNFSTYSCYPGKNLGAVGECGIITTNSESLWNEIKYLYNFGQIDRYTHEMIGYNNKADGLQCIILNEKLKHLNKWNEYRRKVASLYSSGIDNDYIIPPITANNVLPVYHIYTVRITNGLRNLFMKHLKEKNIPTLIHYPIPLHKSTPYATGLFLPLSEQYANEVVSLPIHPFLSPKEVDYIIGAINDF